jgi:hypothetical protein
MLRRDRKRTANTLSPDALARLDDISPVPRGFPHDFLAGADYTGGVATRS